MIKDLLNAIDYSMFSEIALVMFFIVFVSVTIRTLLMSNKNAEAYAQMVLTDKQENSENESAKD